MRRTLDRVVYLVLGVCTLLSAVSSTVNPWPRDDWFDTRLTLFGHYPGADNYAPVAAPALLFRLGQEIAGLLGLDLAGEMYVTSLLQNVLVLLSAVLVYRTGRLLLDGRLAGGIAIAFLLFVLSTGLPQAFWSETVVLFLFSGVLYLALKLWQTPPRDERGFWWAVAGIGVLTGLLVTTRMTPVFLIPGFALLFAGRLGWRRYAGLLGVTAASTGLLLLGLALSNVARFDRFELTSSSGRHLWQGVSPIAEQALADSEAFRALEARNPGLGGLDYWDIEYPPAMGVLERDELVGSLAREAILARPVLYLRTGLGKFRRTIAQRPYRLGFGDRGPHPDPLGRDEPLPPIGARWLAMPSGVLSGSAAVSETIFEASDGPYAVVIFLTLSTVALIALSPLLDRIPGRGPPWAAGVAVASGGGLLAADILSTRAALVVAAVLLGMQTLLVLQRRLKPPDRDQLQLLAFLAFLFFGSLWFSWQVEIANSRNAVPYLPFLAVLVGLACSWWGRALRDSVARTGPDAPDGEAPSTVPRSDRVVADSTDRRASHIEGSAAGV